MRGRKRGMWADSMRCFERDFPKQSDLRCWYRLGRHIAPSVAQYA